MNHLETKFQTSFVNSSFRKNNISNPLPDKIEDTIRKYLRIHYDKNIKFRIVLLLKFLKPSNQIKYNRIQRSSRCYKLCVPNAIFFSKIKIIKEQLFSQLLEL